MEISIFNQKDFQKSRWSGGTTTQLYIAPAGSSYAERNFEVRISTAKVEVKKSVFTSLPGISRKLMVLDGEIDIIHLDRYQKHLKAFEMDSFEGDWNTTSVGRCTDFNVMIGPDKESDLSVLDLRSGEKKSLTVDVKWKTWCLYVYRGNLKIETGNIKQELKEGQLVVITELKGDLIELEATGDNKLIIVQVN